MSLCPLSKYKNIFGIPGKGAHKFRVLNTAIVDYVLTILLAFVLAYFTQIPLTLTTIGTFILGIVAHMVFGVPTQEIKYLGLAC